MIWRIALALALWGGGWATAMAADDLYQAVKDQDSVTAARMIKSGADVNVASGDGTMPLHWAIQNHDVALIRQLIKAGADVEARNDYGATPMTEAAQVGDPAILEMLLKAGVQADAPGADGQTPLMVVADAGNVAAAKMLLKHGADVHKAETWQGQTALMWAAAGGHPEMVALLIKHGADVNARAKVLDPQIMVSAEPRAQYRAAGGFTPLLYAVRAGCIPCAEALIKAGAEVDMTDPDGVTPLIMAINNLHFDLAKYLLKAGASPNRWDWWGRTPLYAAVDMNTIPHGGRPDRRSLDTTTSLEIAKLLLDAGANPDAQLKLRPPFRNSGADRGCDRVLAEGTTPLLRAAKALDAEAIELLLQHKANPNLSTRTGVTPVMAAAGLASTDCDTRGYYHTDDVQKRSIASLKPLLAAGGDVTASMSSPLRDIRDDGWRKIYARPTHSLLVQEGQTALHGAAYWGWNEVVTFLVENGADLEARDAAGKTVVDAAMGRAGGNGFLGQRVDVHEDTAKLLKDLMSRQTASR
jgi:ankyrin repeat protein